MALDPNELKQALIDNPGILDEVVQQHPTLAPIVQAGMLAKKREAARELLEYARGRLATALATYDDAAAPILDAKARVEQATNQVIAQIEAVLADLTADRDVSLPSKEQVDAVAVVWSE